MTAIQLEPRLLERIALKAYDDARVDYCVNPNQLARGLGLHVRPTMGGGEIVGDLLLTPALPSRREIGLAVYEMLASHLLQRNPAAWSASAAATLTGALVLPRVVAMKCPREALAEAQRFAPLAFIERIYDGYPGSGRLWRKAL
ncbi:MAG TPA: hypothetical protein VK550_36055 [Polyangiaceae bacterium]|nr:hypothetical protein [Polyangiaceae bacterium]